MHPLLARVHDSNVYVLHEPSHDKDMLVVGMLHPFSFNDRGYEARVYRVPARRVTLSPAVKEEPQTGFGIDGIRTTARGVVTLSNDEDLWIRIELVLPCDVDVETVTLDEHPKDDVASYLALRSLEANDDIEWEPTPIISCAELKS